MIPLTVWNAIATAVRTPLVFGLYAMIGTVVGHALFYWLMGVGRQKAARKALDQAEAYRDTIRKLKAQLWDMSQELAQQTDRADRLDQLVDEERNHNRNFNARATAERRRA